MRLLYQLREAKVSNLTMSTTPKEVKDVLQSNKTTLLLLIMMATIAAKTLDRIHMTTALDTRLNLIVGYRKQFCPR